MYEAVIVLLVTFFLFGLAILGMHERHIAMAKESGVQGMPHCPAGGIYTIGRIDELPTCSIPTHRLPGIPLKLFVEDEKGSWLSGVSVEVIDNNGGMASAFTDTNGMVEVGSYSTNKAVAVILSRNGYNTISNSLPLPPEAFGVGGVRMRTSKPNSAQ